MQNNKLYNIKTDFIEKDVLFKKLKEEFSEFSFSQLKEVTDAPFSAMKEDLKKDKLFIYRFENLGTFYCNVGRAKYYLNSVKENVEKGSLNQKRGEELISMLEDFIKRKS